MSDKQKSPAKSEVSTPGTKKKVYVLTPDTLKKLGISSKLPSLQSLSIDDKKHTPIKTQEVSKDDITKINITLKVPENKPKIIIKKIEILRPADKLPIINRNQATYSTKKTKPIRLELPLRKNREAVEYETPEYQTMQILSDIKLSGKTESSQQNSCSDVDDKSTRSLIEDKFIEPYEFKDVSTESDITLPEINTSDSYTIENQFFYTPYKSINYENYDRHMFDYINNPVYYLDIPRSREVTEEVENDFNLNTHDDDTNYNLTEYLEEEGINLDKALEAIEKRDTRFCFGCYKCDLDLECSKISIYDIATIEDPFAMLGLELARYKRICEQITTALDKLDKFCPVDKEEDLSDDELCASSETSSVISTTENSSIEDEESAVSSSSSAEEIIGIASDKENSVIPEEAEKQDQIDNSSIEDDVTSTDSLESTESFSSADETTSVTSNTENSGNELSTEDENLSEDEATDSSLESMYKATLPFLPKKNHYELYLMEKKLILDDVSSKDQSLLQEEEMNLPSGPEDTDKNLQTGSDAEANSSTKEAIEDQSFEDIEDDNLEKRDTKKSKKKVLSTPHIKTGIRKFAKYRRNRRKPKFQHDCAEVDTDEILESVIKNNIIVNDYISMLSSQATNKNESIQVEDDENQLNDVKTSSFTSTTSTETANSGSENEANSPTKEVIKDLTQKQDQIDNSSIEDDVASTDSLESTESFSSADETTSVASNTKNIENDHREEIKKIKKLLSFVHEQIKILKKRSKLRRIQKRLLKNWLVEDIDIVLKPVIEIELTAIDFKSISSSQAKNEDKSKDDENQQDDLLIDQNTNDIKLEQVLKHYRDGLLQTGWLVEDIDLGSLQATNEDDEKQENDNSSLKKYRSLQNGWIVEDINIIQESVDDYKSISSPQATNEDESIRATVSQNQQTDEEQSDFTPNTLSRATSSELLMSLEIENRLLRFEAEMNSSTEEVIEDQSFEDNLVVSSSESVYRKSSGKSSSSEDVSAIPLSQLVTNKLFETENKLKSDDESIQSTVSQNQQTDEEQSDFTPNTLSRATSSEQLLSLEIENRLLRSESEMNSSTEEVIEDQSFEDNLVESSSESSYRNSTGKSSNSEDVWATPLSQLDTNASEKQNVEENLSEDENISMSSIAATIEDQPFLEEKETNLPTEPSVTEINLAEESKLISSLQVTNEDESMQEEDDENFQNDDENSDFTPDTLTKSTSIEQSMLVKDKNLQSGSEAEAKSSTEDVIEDQSYEDIDEINMEDSDTKKRKQKNLSRPCIKRGIKKFVRYRRNRRKPELKSTQKLSLIEQKANDHSEDSNGLASTLNKSFSVKEDKSQEKDCFLEDIDVILEPMTENNLIVDDCISISSSSQDTNEDESIQLENDMNHKEPIASTSKKSLLEESMSFSSSQEDTEENVYHQKDVLISSSQSTSGYESLVLEDGLLSSSQAISECDSFVGQDVHRIIIKENKVDVTLITSPETNTEQSCTEEDKIILPLEQGHRIRKRKINTARNFFVKKCSKRMKVLCTSKMSMRRKRQSMLKEKDINKYPMQKTRTNSFEDEISVETTNQPEHQANNLIGNDIPIVTSTEKLIVEDSDTVNNLDEEDSMSISSTGATIGEQSISLDDYENLKDDIPITSALLLNDESDLISFKGEVLPTSSEKRIVEDSENSLDEDSMSISSTGATIGEQSFSLDDRDEILIKDDIPITSALVTSRSENEEIMPLNIKNLKLFDDNDKDFSTSTVRELKTDSTRDNIPEEKESISESTGKRKSGRFRKQPAQRTQLADEESEENMQSRKNKLEIFDDEKVSTKRLKSSTVTELKTDLTNGDNNMEKQTYSKFNVHTITKKLKAGRPRKKTDQRTQLTNEESEENRSSTKRKFEKVNDEEVLTKRINSSTVKKLEANFNKEKFSIPVPTDNTKPNKRRQGRPKKGVKPVEEYFIENNLVTCAVCKVKLNNKSWPLHKVKHYYLCWREGETEIDLNDRQEITTHLTRYLKEKKGMLVCAKCGDRKKSVIGYFSHQDQCEKTKQELLDMRVPCPICNNLMLPVSIKPHMDQIHRTIPVVQEENIPLELDIGRNKREAAIKAFDLIKEVAAKEQPKVTETEERIMYKKVNNKTKAYLNKCFWMDYALKNHKTHSCTYNDCEFVTNNLEEFKSHVSKCPELKTNDFICTYCIFTTSEESDMEKHIKENHALVDISDDESNSYQFSDDSDLEATSETSSPKKKTQTAPFIFQKPDFLTQDKKLNTSVVCAYPTTMKWTKELYECNFSEELFKDFKINKSSDWLPLTSEEQLKYYPDLKESMSVKHINLTNQVPKLQSMVHEWKNYKLYEATIENGTATLFCGGPIWALAWTPTPLNKIEDQILAVSIQKDVNKLFKISKCYRSEEVIQFWNFGAITNENKMTEPPKLEFNLIHNHGQVWCMEWCPSGCYQEPNPEISDDLGRLGLLALACSDGNIAIYSIPMFDKTKRNSDEILFYKPKEIYRLVSEQEIGFWDAQVTKLCWSKGKGHNVIAGGFSNGAVILWNLDNTSTVTKSVKDGVIILKPSTSFKPHSCAISALTLHPLDGGSRYLYTGSWDKTTKYWDLENIYTPISSFLKKGLITDGVWMSNWICSFTAYDDVFNYSHTVTTIQNARDCGFKQAAVLATNSLVNSISANDWANAIVQASVVGEITMSVQRQLLNTFDEKSVKNKRISLGYSELIDKTLTPTERDAKEIRIKKKKEFDKNKKEKSFHNKYYLERQNEQLYEEEPEDYQSAQEKYGLIFCDPDLNDYENIPPDLNKMLRKSNKMRETILDLYSLQSINRTAWNPNYQSHLYLAYGHQIGFARVNCVRFLNKPQEE